MALFLDYDGTLAELCEHPSKAVLTTAMRDAVAACAARDDTDVAVVSGRSLEDIRKMVGDGGLTYAGNHGLEIAGPGLDDFEHEDLVHYRERTEALARALEGVARDGAWTEAKGPTLTYHYREVAAGKRAELARRRARSSPNRASRRATRSSPSRRARRSAGTRGAQCCTSCANATACRGPSA